MTLLWQNAVIKVGLSTDGVPLWFTWNGRRHTVEMVARRWRVDFGWWRWHVWREHYKLTTRTGLLVIIYRDLDSGEWFLQRIYD